MIRTIEALFVVVIVLGSLMGVIYYIDLPSPRTVTSIGLGNLAKSTLESLNDDYFLTETVFSSDAKAWSQLQNSLQSSFSPNIMYRLSIYDIELSATGESIYQLKRVLDNFNGDLPPESESASNILTSPDTTLNISPEKIGTRYGPGVTLYILNCEDANGWWITGYTAQTLAHDIYHALSPYFTTTLLVNSTSQLQELLNNNTITTLETERITDAVVVNPFGEAVPIPLQLANSSFYSRYPWYLGQKVRTHNWTWVSIVGYPLYYVTNMAAFSDDENSWGIYGMKRVGPAGFNGFLQGLNNNDYAYNSAWITQSLGVVQLTNEAQDMSNYYGIYPESYQTATRALSSDTLANYNVFIDPQANIFDPIIYNNDPFHAGATYSHFEDNIRHGSFTAIGLARTPDIRITILGLLMFYRPNIYRTEFGASGTSKLVVLQLGQVGSD